MRTELRAVGILLVSVVAAYAGNRTGTSGSPPDSGWAHRLRDLVHGRPESRRLPTPLQESASKAALPFTLKAVGRNIWAAIDVDGRAGSNAGFVIGDDGVVVIDTFEQIDAARALLAEIRKRTSLPVKFVVNTHYHLDHVAGNGVFSEEGATVMAQRNVRAWIHTDNLKFFGKNIKPADRAMVEAYVAPDVVYDSGVTLYLGSRAIRIKVFPGHTGGDSVVSIPGGAGIDLVFCGDLFWRHSLPNLIDANTERWIETLRTFTGTARRGTMFVPGHGDVGNADDVDAFRRYLTDLRSMVAGAAKEGKSGDELVAAVMPSLTEKYGQWGIFKHFAKPNILDVAAELRGDKTVPKPVPAQ